MTRIVSDVLPVIIGVILAFNIGGFSEAFHKRHREKSRNGDMGGLYNVNAARVVGWIFLILGVIGIAISIAGYFGYHVGSHK